MIKALSMSRGPAIGVSYVNLEGSRKKGEYHSKPKRRRGTEQGKQYITSKQCRFKSSGDRKLILGTKFEVYFISILGSFAVSVDSDS